MTDSSATLARSVVCDLPDYPFGKVAFHLATRLAIAGTETFPTLKYELTLDGNGQGTQVLPTPDNTGDASWLWNVVLPNGSNYRATLAYSASSIQLSAWLVSAAATVTANSIADQFVAVAGDIMTGPLTLSGAPTVDLHAATKAYVDTADAAAEGGRLDWNFSFPGSLSQNVNMRWTVPSDCRILHISAVSSNNSDATFTFGISTDPDSILNSSAVGDSGVPAVYNSGDWAGTNPTGDLTAGQVAVLTVDYDGAAGTAAADLTVVITTTGNAAGDLADIADLAAAGFSTDDYTKWNGSLFVNVTPAGVLSDIGAAALRPSANEQTGTSYTLALTDEDKIVHTTNGSTVTITVPPNSSVAFPEDAIIGFEQRGTGTLSWAAGAGVTIRSLNGSLSMSGQYGSAALRKIGTDEWMLVGSLA